MGLMAMLILMLLIVTGVAVTIALGTAAVGSLLKGDGRRGGAQVSLTALFVAAPVLAAKIAERTTRWVDADSNGILDPMSNGSYDWFDVNASRTALIWGLLTIPLLVASVFTSREGGST